MNPSYVKHTVSTYTYLCSYRLMLLNMEYQSISNLTNKTIEMFANQYSNLQVNYITVNQSIFPIELKHSIQTHCLVLSFFPEDLQILPQMRQMHGSGSDAILRMFWRRRLSREPDFGARNDGRADALRPQHLHAGELRSKNQRGRGARRSR